MAVTLRATRPDDLTAAVREFRTLKGLSQVELAELAGVNRQYVSDLERGHVVQQVRYLLRLLQQLGVEVTLTMEEA
ncbi:MAG: helix-turn-helix transcriptional regulator [Acidimicrobiales bacterium]